MDAILKIGGLFLFFVAAMGAIYGLLPKPKGRETRLAMEKDSPATGGQTAFLAPFRPFFPLLRPIVKQFPLTNYRQHTQRFLVTAGVNRELPMADFLSFQLLTTILFAAMAFLLWKDVVFSVLSGALGMGYPYLWLYDKKKTRQREIELSMPDMVDMMALSVEAGLDFLASIKRIVDINKNTKDPFVHELSNMYQNVKLGMSTEEALNIMAERVDIQEMHSFASILIQAQKMGASISDILKSQAERMRRQRFMKAERVGAAAAQKLLIPMILFIFPILFIVIFGPYLLKFIYE